MSNPMELLKLKDRLEIFNGQHPKALAFFQNVYQRGAVKAGSVLEIKVTGPEGETYVSNIRVTPEDMETMKILKNIKS